MSRHDGGPPPRSSSATMAAVDPGASSVRGPRLTVLAILSDASSRALFPKVVRDRLLVTDDLAEGLALAEQSPPDVAFVEIGMGDGAGLALVHHLKAVVPGVSVYALSSRRALEAAANAVALGGSGLIMMPVGGDEILSAIGAVKIKLADKAMRAEYERASLAYARAAGWMARVAALAASTSRAAAAEQLVEVLIEATGAAGAAIYLSAVDRPNELTRAAASPAIVRSPPLGLAADVLDYARRERLLLVPMSVGAIKAGHLLPTQSEVAGHAGRTGPDPSSTPDLRAAPRRRGGRASTAWSGSWRPRPPRRSRSWANASGPGAPPSRIRRRAPTRSPTTSTSPAARSTRRAATGAASPWPPWPSSPRRTAAPRR